MLLWTPLTWIKWAKTIKTFFFFLSCVSCPLYIYIKGYLSQYFIILVISVKQKTNDVQLTPRAFRQHRHSSTKHAGQPYTGFVGNEPIFMKNLMFSKHRRTALVLQLFMCCTDIDQRPVFALVLPSKCHTEVSHVCFLTLSLHTDVQTRPEG